MKLQLVGKQSSADEAIFVLAKEAKCKPIWHNGIYGWAYHCGCKNLAHASDQQCSLLTEKSITRISDVK